MGFDWWKGFSDEIGMISANYESVCGWENVLQTSWGNVLTTLGFWFEP